MEQVDLTSKENTVRKRLSNVEASQFLHWAGGKKRVLKHISKRLPETIDHYIEPFLGGGSVFYYTRQNYNPFKFQLSDTNQELILTYEVVQKDVLDLIDVLILYKKSFDRDFFYTVRALNPNNLTKLERAARFILLNKTCFNGLYRVNKKGEFNVPFGSKPNPSIFTEENLYRAHLALEDVKLLNEDFSYFFNVKDAFFYLDPPYLPLNKTSNFTSYTANGFNINDHIRLFEFVKTISENNKFLMSNSHHVEILNLYKEYNIEAIKVSRPINSNGKKRGNVGEVLISNF